MIETRELVVQPRLTNGGNHVLWCMSGQVRMQSTTGMLNLRAGDLGVAPADASVVGEGVVIRVPNVTADGVMRRITLGTDFSPVMVAALMDGAASGKITELICHRPWAPSVPIPLPARKVALQIMKQPEMNTALVDFAAQQHVSARTLQRQFESSTGLPFSEWRAAYRVYRAHGALLRGATLDQAAHEVGFGATSSLSRAFIRHAGISPGKTVRNMGVPELPGVALPSLADVDQAFWVYRGTATVTARNYCRFAAAGETITIPAGTDMSLEVAANSVVIPIQPGVVEDIDSVAMALRYMASLAGTISQ